MLQHYAFILDFWAGISSKNGYILIQKARENLYNHFRTMQKYSESGVIHLEKYCSKIHGLDSIYFTIIMKEKRTLVVISAFVIVAYVPSGIRIG